MTNPRDDLESEVDFDDDPTITFPAAEAELAEKHQPQPLARSGSRKLLLPVPVGH